MNRPLLVAAVLGTVALAPAVAQAAPTATLTPTTAFDSANRQVNAGPGTTRTYTVRSTGADPLVIAASALTGADAAQFSLADTCAGRTLALDETCTVAVAFNPTVTGARSTTLQLTTNGPTLTSAAITGTGRDLTASPAAVDLGSTPVGTPTAAQTVTLTNNDAAAYTLGTVGVPSGFTKSADTCSAVALAPGASCTVAVAFNGGTSPGAVNGNLTVASFGPAPATVRAIATQASTAVSPGTRDFGLSGAPQDFTLTNTGNRALAVSAVELAGGAPSAFSIEADGCSGQSLAPGATCTATVAFAGDGTGWQTALVRFVTDAAVPATLARVGGWGAVGAGPLAEPFALADQPLLRYSGDGDDGAAAVASGPCDVNGDGIDDLIVGASTWSRTPAERSWEGAAYVYLGSARPGSADLAGDRVIRIEGAKESAQTGSVACAGDVNGDGIDDIAVGGWAYEYDGRPSGTAGSRGAAWVVFGATDLAARHPIDLALLGAGGYRIVGNDTPEFDHLGFALAGVGDLDGDGRDDLAVMANTGDTTDATPARTNNGLVWVVPGQAASGTVDLSVPGSSLLTIHGASPGSTASPWGQMVDLAGLGDVDGDGIGDIGIGTYTATYAGRTTASGAAFVVSGAKRGRVDLADSSSWTLAVGGAFAGHRLGIALRSAGDVNGDGRADLLIGADSTAAANSDAAYVVYGGADAPGTILDSADLGTRGYRILGATNSRTGYGIDGVGDVNGDGIPDQLVTAYDLAGAAGSGTGKAWIVYGVADPTTLPANDGTLGLVPANAADHTRTLSLATLTAAQGTVIEGQTAGERFGRTAAAIGDLDANGRDDLAIGADFATRFSRTGAGEVSVALLPGPTPDRPADPVTPGISGGGETPAAEEAPAAAASQEPVGAPGPAATPVTAPRPTRGALPILGRRTLKPDRTGRIALALRCPAGGGACRGTLVVRAAGTRTRSVAYAVDAGRARTLRVTLPKAARTALRRERQLTATLVLTAGDARRTIGLTVTR